MAMGDRRAKNRPEAHDGVPLRVDQTNKTLELRRENVDLRQEIARLRIENRRLIKAANTDELTQIFNLAGLNKAFAGTLEKGAVGAVIIIDLDKFKDINDTRGHAAGDEVLKKVAQTLTRNVRKNDIVARTGGDEFLIVLEGASQQDAQKKLEEFRQIFTNLFIYHNEIEIKINASFGMATYNAGDDIDAVKAQADAKMYASKATKHGAGITPS